MSPSVRKRARDGDRPRPNKLAICGLTRSTYDKFLSCLSAYRQAKPNKSKNQLKRAEKACRVTDVDSGYTDVLGHDSTSADDDMVADCNRKHGGIRAYGYMIPKIG